MAIDTIVEPSNGLAALLRRDGFRRLTLGQVVSGIGDWMVTLALMVLAHDVSGSSAAVGAVLVLRLLPTLIAGPLVARIVLRWDRRSTMLAMDAVRAGIVLAIPIVDTLWWIYLWAFLLELAGLIFLPARDSAVPDLTHRDSLPLANGVMLGASYGTIPFGALLFGIVSWIGGGGAPFAVFVVDAATFAVSFWFIAGVHLVDVVDPESSEEVRFTDALRLPIVRAVGPAALVTALGLGTLFSMGVVFVQDILGASTLQFGALVALFGIGAAGGLGLLAAARRADVHVVRLCIAVQGGVVAALSQAPTILAAFLGAILFGAATAAGLATAMSVLQGSGLSDRDQVLAFTAFHVLIRGGLGLAALGAGLAGDFLGGLEWPLLGTLPPARAVLFAAGVIVAGTAVFIRMPPEPAGDEV